MFITAEGLVGAVIIVSVVVSLLGLHGLVGWLSLTQSKTVSGGEDAHTLRITPTGGESGDGPGILIRFEGDQVKVSVLPGKATPVLAGDRQTPLPSPSTKERPGDRLAAAWEALGH